MTTRSAVLILCLSATARVADAQCPDGSPPPCPGARRIVARPTPSAAERARRFLVLPFRNVTRGPEQDWLVEGSPILLADAIGRWQDLSVVSDERLYPAMRRHGLLPGTVMELGKVRRVAEETDSWTAVTGEVLAIGGQVRVSARAYDVVTNRELMRATAETQPGEDVRRAYNRIGSRLLGSAGLDSSGADVEAATTHSLEAYRHYLRGVSHLRKGEARRAKEALLEAVRLDTAFAQAYMQLAMATMTVSPADILDPTSATIRYFDRAAALSDRLPPRRRDVVRAMSDVVHGRFTAARTTLSHLVETDSNDVDAVEWLGSLETVDFLLVPAPGGGERPRGSINSALRLLKRALQLDPSRHNLYSDLVVHYAQGAGFGAGPRGYRREPTSLGAMMLTPPDRSFTLVMLRDSFDLVPSDSLATIPADTLAAAKRRALAAAGAWARQWRREAPVESDAHLWLSRVYDLEGSLDSALSSLNRADSLGVETGIEVPAIRRMGLLRRLGRFSEARVIAESLWAARDIVPIGPRTRADAAAEVLRAFLMAGNYSRADSIVSALADALTPQANRQLAEAATLGLLSGDNDANILAAKPTAPLVDSLLAVMKRQPPTGRVARWLPLLIGIAARNTGPDTNRARQAILASARDFATHGQGILGLHLVASLDSATRRAAGNEPWAEALRAPIRDTLLATARRFQPQSATVSGDSVVFEWSVQGGDSATWNRASTPVIRDEYSWTIWAGAWRTNVTLAGRFDDRQQQGPLSQLLTQAARASIDTVAAGSGVSAVMAAMASARTVRAEAAPARLRIVVRQPPFAEALRRQRPASAQFRFSPCPKEGEGVAQCVDQAVPITYP